MYNKPSVPDPQFQMIFDEAIATVRQQGKNADSKTLQLAAMGVLMDTLTKVVEIEHHVINNNGNGRGLKSIVSRHAPGTITGGGLVALLIAIIDTLVK